MAHSVVVAVMTKKHYVMLAHWCGQSNVSDYRVENLIEILEEDNPRFDKQEFWAMFKNSRALYEIYNKDLIKRLRA